MKYKVINECNVIEYYEQTIEANSEEEAIEIAEERGERNKMDSKCEDSNTYISEEDMRVKKYQDKIDILQ